jgi:VWFA-related protein
MTILRYVCALTAAALSVSFSLAAQQQSDPAPSTSQSIRQVVFVDTKSGQPVTDLEQKDFTVFDNKSPRPITSFRRLDSAKEPVSVILLIDAVNTPYQTIAYAREGIEKFLKLNEGQLASPTSLAVLTDQGVQMRDGFTSDGNTLSDELERQQIGLRELTRNSEWSGPERLQICVNALHQLMTTVGPQPGRKLVIWISPGWPLVSGPRVYLDSRQEQQIFSEVVNLSTHMREFHITMYDANPFGVAESMTQADYYEAFLKGVAKLNEVQLGDLAIQVLAVQSGGLAIESNSDVTGMIKRFTNDAKSWYEIGFGPLPTDKPNEYHHTEIKVDRPGAVVRTRDGYYANPVAIQAR